MKTLSSDTSPEVERVQIALFRSAPVWRRLVLAGDLSRTVRTLAIQGWRQRHPSAEPVRLPSQMADLWLGADLAAQIAERMPREGDLVSTDPIAITLLVIDELEALGVPYLLGGSLASSALGAARSTLDADIVADVREGHAERLAHALEGTFYLDVDAIRDAVRRRASFSLIHLESMFKVDVFVPRDSAFDRSQLARRVSQQIQINPERRIFIASPEDIVLAKLDWYRQGGGVSERQWNDVLGVLKVQAEDIDRAYLRKWASTLDLTDLLDRALDDAGLV